MPGFRVGSPARIGSLILLLAALSGGCGGSDDTAPGWVVLGQVVDGTYEGYSPPPEYPAEEFPVPEGAVSVAPVPFTDPDGSVGYELQLVAGEWDEGEVGQVTALLRGGGIELCSSQGARAFIDPHVVVAGDATQDPGLLAYERFQDYGPIGGDYFCGTASHMAVDVDGCEARIQFHGYLHSDHPSSTYMGPVTVDVRIEKGGDFEPGGSATSSAAIEIFTPLERIDLEGPLFGPVAMPAC